ncbi:P-loop containing nucleoside triphosphate hydrolase protein [Earliella scabrosa]|nr:P-loop containing nucleoside triphosphate hydrolase protein [Earliella scabrosa]
MYWLSYKKVFQSARNIEVSSDFYGMDSSAFDDLGENESGDNLVSFFPSLSRTYSMWYKRRYMLVRRERDAEGGGVYRRPKELLKISMLTRNTHLLRELIAEARQLYKSANEHLINVFVAESADHWKRVAAQEKRPKSSVILDPGVLDHVLEDAKDFMNSRQWYADRGIPFRRGYLLHGAPGAGKTSLIHSLAGELGLDIYILSLTVLSLDDNSLKSLIAHLPRTCILLIEDIDAAFTRGVKRDIADPEKQGLPAEAAAQSGDTQDKGAGAGRDGMSFGNGVTLSGLLNALDGIAAQEGRILFATTNDYSALDPALLRPGRLDLHVEFHLASKYQATELFKRFYSASSAEEDGKLSDEKDEEADDADREKDSGYNSRSSSPSRSSASTAKPAGAVPEGVSSVYVGLTRPTHAPQLSRKKAAELAEKFAEIIPARTFSMATLQGYLMAYKIRPYDAVADAPAWVEKRLQEKAAKEEGKVAKEEGGVSASS